VGAGVRAVAQRLDRRREPLRHLRRYAVSVP
jgi:hypothetical protein